MMNKTMYTSNSSGLVGVAYRSDCDRWRAQIAHKGKNYKLGSYFTKEEAIAARKAGEIILGFHDNHGNNKPSEADLHIKSDMTLNKENKDVRL